ncbi:hypothetical protein SLEP1_g56922 [Rubroshorea leprosula]|uniref:Uncharacterized protein n=1 Tax=Rubroshorea leprosula TaxID=152421 RepID=A0AAV5MK61_9ROSI|nr:hypothetical protein SLEP1_g56922 [Rubroshorea leprosula]
MDVLAKMSLARRFLFDFGMKLLYGIHEGEDLSIRRNKHMLHNYIVDIEDPCLDTDVEGIRVH